MSRSPTQRQSGEGPEIANPDPALALAREALAALTQASQALLWLTDADGACAWVSGPWLAFTGRSLEQELGEGWTHSLDPAHRELWRTAQAAAHGSVQPYRLEYRRLRADGSARQLLEQAQPRFAADGRFAGLAGSTLDVTEQRQCARALVESEERFHRAIDQAPFPLLIHAEDGSVLGMSRAWSEITGYTRDDIPTIADWTARAYGQRQAQVRADIDQLYDLTGRKAEGEYWIRCADGRERVWDFSSMSLGRLSDGRRAAISMAADVTERRQAEQELLELKAAVDQSVDGMAIFNLDGGVRYINGAWAAMHGLDAGAVVGRHLAVFHTPAQMARDVEPMIERARRVGTGEGDVGHVHADGRTFPTWMKLTLLRGADGQPTGFIGSARDITTRKAAEDALRASEDRHRRLFQDNPHPMWAYDLETLAFLAVNDAAVAHYGYSREEFLAMTIADIRPAEDLPRLMENVARVGAGVDEAGVWRHRRKDGSLIEVEITSHVTDFEGRRAEVVLAHDVTAGRRVELTLRANQQRLASMLQLAQSASTLSEEEIVHFALEEVVKLTGSAIGYLHFVNEDQNTIRLVTWSDETLRVCAAVSDSHYPLDAAGVWADCARLKRPVIHNDYQGLPNRHGYPAGHVHLLRHVSVPVLDGPLVRIIMGVGNKPVDYDEDDVAQMTLVASTLWKIMAASRAQAELREQTSRYRSLMHTATDGIHILDPEGWLIEANPAFLEGLGYPAAPLPRLHVSDWDAGYSREELAELLAAARRGGATISTRHRRRDGSVLDAEVSTSPARIGDTELIYCAARDITGRKRAELALRTSEEQFRATFDQAAVGIAQVSPEGRWMRVNRRLCEILGYTEAEMLARTFQDITHPEDLEANLAQVRDVLAGRIATYAMRKRYRHKSGRLVWANLTVSLVRDEAGAPKYFVSVVEDITTLKAAEDRFMQLNAELEARVAARTRELEALNQELQTFAYSVSHDLKAPLRGIDGYGRLLEEDWGARLDDEGRGFLANIRRGTRQMAELIDDLLAYSRMERRALGHEPVDLGRLVDAVLAERAEDIAARGVRVEVDVPALTTHADAEGLLMVLRNLVDNALKFSRAATPPRIWIGASEGADSVTLWVRDNGIGFDMKFRDRIFELFQRLQRAEDYPGTGIGLALVRKAMQRLGGAVDADGKPGEGATFRLTLPR